MFKKFAKVVGVLAILTVAGLFAVGTVFAQGPTPPAPWGPAWGGLSNGYTVISEALSKLLDMTPQEIYDAHAAGQTLSEIAKAKGITDQQLIDAMLAGREEVVNQAIQDGRITQEQADWMEARMDAVTPYMITNPLGPGGFGGRRFGMSGGYGPWSGTPPTTTP
ncbi:MAG: hypothetical protein A3K45_05495 [Chloroflexi bacterium RIFOXYC12_FULL_59_14]|nr:MAG: hypothetical protein A3K45_05495 [Chloroflexi bacterium RIFOXYC12_FULL_59_14]